MPPRTRRSTKPANPEPEETDEEVAENGLRPVGELHKHMSEWLNDEYGDELDKPLTARQVQVVISKRNEYRKSDEYADFKAEQDDLRDKAAAEKAEKRAARDADTDDDEPRPARRRRGKAAEEETPAEKPARARRGRAKAADTEAAEDAPAKPVRRGRAAATAEEEPAKPARRSRRRGAAATEAEPF